MKDNGYRESVMEKENNIGVKKIIHFKEFLNMVKNMVKGIIHWELEKIIINILGHSNKIILMVMV